MISEGNVKLGVFRGTVIVYNKITVGCHKISSNISVQEYSTISRAKNLNPEIDISVSPVEA